MPNTDRMRLATSPSFTERISGMPPATAASNASVARCASSTLTTPAPTVPSPRRARRTRRTAASAMQTLETAQRLPDAVLVLDECEAHVALAVLAEADARRHRDLRLLDAELRELERAERLVLIGDRRPDEHRALRLLHVPSDLVQSVDQQVAALSVH